MKFEKSTTHSAEKLKIQAFQRPFIIGVLRFSGQKGTKINDKNGKLRNLRHFCTAAHHSFWKVQLCQNRNKLFFSIPSHKEKCQTVNKFFKSNRQGSLKPLDSEVVGKFLTD